MQTSKKTFKKITRDHLWWIIAVLFTISMITGFQGFQEYFAQVRTKVAEDNKKKMRLEIQGTKEFGDINYQLKLTEEPKEMRLDAFDSLYATFQLIIMESGGRSASVPEEGTTIPSKLQFARFAVPLFSILAFIKFLMSVAKEQVALAKIRWRFRKHSIICGLGDKGVSFIRRKLDPDHGNFPRDVSKLDNIFRVIRSLWIIKGWFIKGIVAIESNPNNSEIENMRELGVIVIVGDASDGGILSKAGIGKSEEVYALTGDDDVNVSIAQSAHKLVSQNQKKKAGTIEFFTHVFDPELTTYIMAHKIFSDPGDRLNARLLNTAQVAAQSLLEKDRLKLSVGFQSNSNISPHIMLIGYGVFGEQLVLQIAQYCHYPEGKVRVTVIDKMNGCKDNFLNKYDFITDYIDIEFFEGTGAESIPSALYKKASSEYPVTAICVCVGNHTEGLEISTILKRMECFYHQPLVIVANKSTVQELLNFQDNGNVSAYLNSKNISFVNLVELMCNHLVDNNSENNLIAKCIHETYCNIRDKEDQEAIEEAQRTGKPLPIQHAKDPARDSWELLDEMYKESNRSQARDNRLKLGINGFTCSASLDKTEAISEDKFEDYVTDFAIMEHKRWMLTKFLDGWRFVEGPDGCKDKTMRLNPDLKKWKELQDKVKTRNERIARAIPKYFKAVNKSIYRMKPGNS